jgi:hypothetical protein
MSLYTLPSPYASCLGIITRLRGITRLVNGGLGLLLSPGSVIPGGACGVIEKKKEKGSVQYFMIQNIQLGRFSIRLSLIPLGYF